ncbi:MAG: NAD(P)-dependent alcohol dehydrogenase [Chloroflexi bacterium]|nr:NAD(P)-dependent alcohol dehydrogenase [Chloroflexota bacterium]
MKAIVCDRYGSPQEALTLEDVDSPVPNEDEVLVRVHASSVNFADLAFVKGEPVAARLWSGLQKPKYPITGSDFAGRIEAVGSGVTRFKPGDEVFGEASPNWGCFAEYVAVSEKTVVPKPANLTFEEAGAVPQASVVALQGLRDKGQIQAGKKVLIVGASGGIGTFAVQIAKALGAEVTGVCSTRNVEMVSALGADHLIDYTREDFATGGPRYDLILATAGYRPIGDYRRALQARGIYICTGGSMAQVFEAMLLGPIISLVGSQTLGNVHAHANASDLDFVRTLIEDGRVTPAIDRCYPLSEVPAALDYYGQGRSQGKVVITM